jgi:hypothetical protein
VKAERRSSTTPSNAVHAKVSSELRTMLIALFIRIGHQNCINRIPVQLCASVANIFEQVHGTYIFGGMQAYASESLLSVFFSVENLENSTTFDLSCGAVSIEWWLLVNVNF